MKMFWVAVALTLAGCSTPEPARQAEAPGPAAAPDLANGATITGKVAFAGPKPTVKNLDMSAVPTCMRAHPDGQPSEEVVVNPNDTLKNAFVWVKSGLPNQRWQTPTDAVTLDQKGCMYTP